MPSGVPNLPTLDRAQVAVHTGRGLDLDGGRAGAYGAHERLAGGGLEHRDQAETAASLADHIKPSRLGRAGGSGSKRTEQLPVRRKVDAQSCGAPAA